MKLSDVKTLITSGTIILAVALYLIFSDDPKDKTEIPSTDTTVTEQQSESLVITPALATEKTGKELIDVKFLSANDGDTINVEMEGEKQRVRLLMIDTPEMNYDKGDPMPYAEEAKSFTIDKLEKAKSVQLLFDKGPETDKYDRLLTYVFIDGVSLHELLLKEGLAAVRYVNKPNDTLEAELLEIQDIAKEAKLNIWSHEDYLQKDGFHPEEVNE